MGHGDRLDRYLKGKARLPNSKKCSLVLNLFILEYLTLSDDPSTLTFKQKQLSGRYGKGLK